MSYTSKDPAEIISVSVGIDDLLAVGENPTGATVSISVVKGVDPAVSAMLVGVPVVSGATVSHLVQAGVDGADYKLAFLVDTTGGQRLKEAEVLPVRAK